MNVKLIQNNDLQSVSVYLNLSNISRLNKAGTGMPGTSTNFSVSSSMRVNHFILYSSTSANLHLSLLW